MRVLHVDPAGTWRGGERQVFLLALGLAAAGVETVVAADPRGPLHERARSAGLEVVAAAARGDADPAAIARLLGHIRRFRPDILHLHTARAHGVGGIAARLAGFRPVVVTRRVELPVRGPFGRFKYRQLADHFVAISAAVERALLDAGVDAARITRIPSGVPIPSSSRVDRPDRPWTVGTLAAFTPQKDPGTWVETVRRVAAAEPDARFLWAGEGELLAAVEVGLASAGLSGRCRLPGFLEDPEEFWRAIDVFFLPSAFEALGTVLLDAMARGLPIVTTRVGGIGEVVRDGNEGRLAPAGDADALARGLLELRADPALALRWGDAGRRRAREFDVKHTVDRTLALYGRLLAGEAA